MNRCIRSSFFHFKNFLMVTQARHSIFAHSRAIALRGFCLFIIRGINCWTIGKKSRSNTMPRQLVVSPACRVCHSDLFGIFPKKDAGQASMTALGGARILSLLLCGAIVLLLCGNTSAGIDTVIEFIVSNNPDLQELKGINKSILNQLKVEAKGAASYGQLSQEGTSTIEKAQTRYSVGLTASIPLISPAEKSQRRIDEVQKERTLRLDVAELIKTYKAERLAISEEDRILVSLYNELQWIGKRVEAGVDNQKEYNTKLHDYLGKRKDHELRKEQVSLILEKIISYVDMEKRNQLKGMLNGQDISKN